MKLTVQEIFNKGYIGLKKQGKLSVISGDGCAYRSHDGNKCFFGFSIPDEKYRPSIEGNDASVALKMSGIVFNDPESIVGRMQAACHDGLYNERCRDFLPDSDYRDNIDLSIRDYDFREMEDFAKENGLTVPDLGEIKCQ